MVKTVIIRNRGSVDRAGGALPAFTLIELLVVVAIIALLVAMLTPVIRQAQEVTKTVACAAILRGYQRAMHDWAAVNSGKMVPYYVPHKLWDGVYWWHQILSSTEYAADGALAKYVAVPMLDSRGEQAKMICPKSWEQIDYSGSTVNYIGNWDGTHWYGYNGWVAAGLISDRPKSFIILADAMRRYMQAGTPVTWPPQFPVPGNESWNEHGIGWYNCINYRHEVKVKTSKGVWVTKVTGTGKANVVFSDGSVRTYLFDASVIAPNAGGWKGSGEGQPIPQNPYANPGDFRTESEIDDAVHMWGVLVGSY